MASNSRYNEVVHHLQQVMSSAASERCRWRIAPARPSQSGSPGTRATEDGASQRDAVGADGGFRLTNGSGSGETTTSESGGARIR